LKLYENPWGLKLRKYCSLLYLFLLGDLAFAQTLRSVSSLSEYCQQKAAAPFYAKPHYERFLEKMFLMSAQKVIADELKQSFFTLAAKVSPEGLSNTWENILEKLKNDIKYECKVSGTLFSANQFYLGLLSPYYQKSKDNFLNHDFLLNNLNPASVQKLHSTNMSLARQVFRDICSWNGLVADAAKISTYLDDPAVGLKVLKFLISSPRPIICRDEGCTQVTRREWEATLPRPQEKRTVELDIQDFWCANHFVKRYGISPAMRWKVTFMGDLFLNQHDPFYLHALGIPMVKQWEEKLQSTLVPWAKSELAKMVQRWPWEEELRININNSEDYFDPKIGLEIAIEYGEFDRNYKTFDKIFMHSKLRLNKPLLEWALRFKYKHRESVAKTLSLNIKQQLIEMEKKFHFLNFSSVLHEDTAHWILDRLEQILAKKNISSKSAYVSFPITFKTGIMALKLVHDRQL